MKHAAVRSIFGSAIGVLLAAAGCGKSSSLPGGVAGTGGGSGTGAATGSCANGALNIAFSPMYSAFDGVHDFKIPALVVGVNPAAITWSASDPSMVAIAQDASTGGAMITAQKAGTVTIVATAGTLCGTSVLTIDSAMESDWEIGSARYNDGVALTRLPRMGNNGGGLVTADAGADAAAAQEYACTNCHGDTANGPFKTVQHTPEQAGGFSDDDLKNIFLHGMVPKGGYFDASIVSYARWQMFHQWQMTDDQANGVIVYLRSLAPTAQTGSSNFGNRFDGGFRDRMPGGMGMGMGMGGPPDADNGAGDGGAGADSD